MKIYPISVLNSNVKFNKAPINNEKKDNNHQNSISALMPSYNDHMLFFGARVDKGLERFYLANKDRMPSTVKEKIESLESKDNLTPMEAQRQAFSYLQLADTIEDIKETYPDEELFKNLKNPEDTKASKGFLLTIRENKELMDMYQKHTLKSGENFTVYLVKKIFLENKTLEEINEDLDRDIDEDLKEAFRFNNKDSTYVVSSTLKALGIIPPPGEYRNSLRFTVDGYSDRIGEKIAQANREFWNSLSPEERTVRAKKSVRNFENWWLSIPHDKKLQMIADKQNELDLLKTYKEDNSKLSPKARNAVKQDTTPATNIEPAPKSRVGSNKLSQDDLFKIWAHMNLEIYKENLSDSDRETIQLIRSEKLANRWQEMAPAQKTAFIQKLKAGLERHRYVMIDAWNNSFDVIKDLSAFLISKQIYKPANLLYSSEEFSEFQSNVMTEFWETHPEHAKTLGDNIKKSYAKIKDAYSKGNLVELEREIDIQKARRLRDLALLKLEEKVNSGEYKSGFMPEYMKEFRSLYENECALWMKYLPKSYNEDYFEIIKDNFSEEQVRTWSKNLRREPLSEYDKNILTRIMSTEPEKAKYNNRALEAALATVLYDCTKHPIVYSLSFSDLKVALSQIVRGEDAIDIYSGSLGRKVNIKISNSKIDKREIESLYSAYKKPLSENVLESFAKYYFASRDGNYDKLVEYLKTYGSSLNIVDLNKSAYDSSIKYEMFNRIVNNMSKELKYYYDCYIKSEDIVVLADAFKKAYFKNGQRTNGLLPMSYIQDIRSGLISSIIKKSPKKILKMQKEDDIDSELTLADKLMYSADNETKLKRLAMEQAMADILYQADEIKSSIYGSEQSVYETFLIQIKNSKTSNVTFPLKDGSSSTLRINPKPIISKNDIEKRYNEYLNEINRRRNDYSQDWNIDELICALNPREDAPDIDEYTKNRIARLMITFDR